MTQLTNLAPANSYGDILTTTNNGQWLTNVLQPLQDGFGNNSTVAIATNAVDFNTQGGNTFQINGISLTATVTNINSVCQSNPVLPGVGGLVLPIGNTAQRLSPAVNGAIRYNTDINEIEAYVNGVWVTIS
jgi:hypothetical protein